MFLKKFTISVALIISVAGTAYADGMDAKKYLKAWDAANHSPAWCYGYLSFSTGKIFMKNDGVISSSPDEPVKYFLKKAPTLLSLLNDVHSRSKSESPIIRPYGGEAKEFSNGSDAFILDCAMGSSSCQSTLKSCTDALNMLQSQ